MFEKNLFHIWFQGCENITDERFIINKKSWKDMNPGWKYNCLGEQDIIKACKEFSKDCSDALNRTTNLHTKIDLGRLVILYLNGGINIDMDMYALRPIDYSPEITRMVAFADTGKHMIGVSANNLNSFEKFLRQFSTRNIYNNAFIASSKRNPVLKEIIDVYISNIMSLKETGGGSGYVNKTTGPIMFSNTLHKYLSKYKDTNRLFEFHYSVFEPCDATDKCLVDKRTVAIHNYELSWMSENVKKLYKFYVSNKNLICILIMLFLVYIVKVIFL